MTYSIELTPLAKSQMVAWHKAGQKKAVAKIWSLIEELRLHPTTGTGQVEQLKGDMSGMWSRRIDKKSRLVYRIEDARVTVVVVSVRGHYKDK